MPLTDTTPGMLPTCSEQPLAESRVARRPVVQVFLRKRHLEDQDISWIESRIDTKQTRDTDQHDARAGEHDQRQRNLRRDESVPQPAPAIAGEPARALPQCRVQAAAIRRERRCEAEEQSAPERDDGCERQHRGVDADPIDRPEGHIADVARQQRQQRAHAPVRQQQPGRAAGACEHQAFGEQLPDEASAASAHRRADRQLARAGRRARQQQVGDVRARDQQDEADDAQHRDERRSQARRAELDHRHDADGLAAVLVGIRLGQRAADRVHVALCLRERHVAPDSPDRDERIRSAILIASRPAGRYPELTFDPVLESKRLGHDADDHSSGGVDGNRPADDRRVARIAALPQPVTEHDHAIGARLLFFLQKRSPEEGRHAEHREEARRHAEPRHLFGFTLPGEVVSASR